VQQTFRRNISPSSSEGVMSGTKAPAVLTFLLAVGAVCRAVELCVCVCVSRATRFRRLEGAALWTEFASLELPMFCSGTALDHRLITDRWVSPRFALCPLRRLFPC
jgi:hypothetical protein